MTTEAAAVKPPMRDALVAAAFQLFLERGYEQTTVDDIVALAGVGRRSFFRYFPSKEDVVFPDHERCLADMTAFLAESDPGCDPLERVCEAVRLVLRMYTENPTFSVQRYRLTKQVPGLRAYELFVVWRYHRSFADYLRGRLRGVHGGTGSRARPCTVTRARGIPAERRELTSVYHHSGNMARQAAGSGTGLLEPAAPATDAIIFQRCTWCATAMYHRLLCPVCQC